MADSRIKSVSELLSGFFDRETAARGKGYADFRTAWRAIAGERLAEHSRPVDLRHGTLIVEIEHQGWAQLLQIHKERMLTEIGRRFPELEVRGMAFRLGAASGAATAERLSPKPGASAAPSPAGFGEAPEAAPRGKGTAKTEAETGRGDEPVPERKARGGAESLPPELRAAFERMLRRLGD